MFGRVKLGPMFRTCTAGFYSIDGKKCLPCPAGATCRGGNDVAGVAPPPSFFPARARVCAALAHTVCAFACDPCATVQTGYWSGAITNKRLHVYACRPDPLMCCPSNNCSAYAPVSDPERCGVNRACVAFCSALLLPYALFTPCGWCDAPQRSCLRHVRARHI